MDIYDQEIERLTKECEVGEAKVALYRAWAFGACHSPLFDGLGENRRTTSCATQIQMLGELALLRGNIDPEIISMIQSDPTIPSDPFDLILEQLPTIAKIQRFADQKLGREVPV